MNQPESGTHGATIYDFLEYYLKPARQKRTFYRDLYINEGLSAAQIAEKIGCSKSTVLLRLHEQGIRNIEPRQGNPSNYRLPQAPYGYSIQNRKLVLNPREVRVCRIVVNLHFRQNQTFNQIAQELIRRGIKNRRGVISWQHVTVAGIFKRWKEKLS